MNKNFIKSNFSKATKTYNSEAFVQNNISNKLINIILNNINNNYETIFEFGCGTGFYTRKIIEFLKFKNLIINDICDNINMHLNDIMINNNIKLLIGDIENLDLPKNLSIITSTSALQWLENIPCFFDKCYNLLLENGFLAFSTFGTKNFIQLKNIINISLKYYNLEEIINLLQKNYKIIFSCEEEININFESTLDLLKHFRKTGTIISNDFRWSKSKLEKFDNEYKKLYSKNNLLYLTYNPIYIIAQKK